MLWNQEGFFLPMCPRSLWLTYLCHPFVQMLLGALSCSVSTNKYHFVRSTACDHCCMLLFWAFTESLSSYLDFYPIYIYILPCSSLNIISRGLSLGYQLPPPPSHMSFLDIQASSLFDIPVYSFYSPTILCGSCRSPDLLVLPCEKSTFHCNYNQVLFCSLWTFHTLEVISESWTDIFKAVSLEMFFL